ncbi:MAG: heparan-alpha-glucosaminide N-acetyltransferase domain-containing protein [Candidatus Hodarchaeota archaeon]
MKRFIAIDIFRGLCIFYMTVGHMVYWWVSHADFWLYEIVWNYGAPIGGGGFLLVSGMSASLSYRNRVRKAKISGDIRSKSIRNEYMLRALIILFISIVWNFIGTLYMDLPGIWLWFVIQTISISLIMAWPLLRVSKIVRLIICFISWIGNELLFLWLSPYNGQLNILGIIFYILYNTPEQNVILGYFPYLLLGTVIGDIFFEASLKQELNEQNSFLKEKLIKSSIVGGTILILFGVVYRFPEFSYKETFSSHMFIVGIELFLISILVYLKDFKKFHFKKSYRVLEYYSFYSFTIFLAHNLLYFLFQPRFNAIEIWLYIIPIIILWTLLFRFIYKKWGKYGSLKFLINKSAVYISERIELLHTSRDEITLIKEK